MNIIVLFYALFVIALTIGVKLNLKVKNPKQNRFSVLIACRNEEANLPALFDSLQKLDYPNHLFELIIVDDASEDESPKLLDEFCKNRDNFFSYHLAVKDKEYLGKKAALKLASEKAKYEILLLTDADCVVPENWLSSYNHHLNEEIDLVTGSVLEPSTTGIHNFSNRMNSGIYASTSGLRIPFGCSGGNFCIRKSRFEKVGGYSQIKHYLAGDDKMMLNLVKKSGGKITYNPESLVLTAPVKLDKKFDQKKRRYGKFNMSTIGIKLLQIAILAFYIYLPFSLAKGEFYSFIIYYLAALAFLTATINTHKLKWIASDFVYVLIFPYYLIFYSIAGMMFKWKWK